MAPGPTVAVAHDAPRPPLNSCGCRRGEDASFQLTARLAMAKEGSPLCDADFAKEGVQFVLCLWGSVCPLYQEWAEVLGAAEEEQDENEDGDANEDDDQESDDDDEDA